MHSNTNILNNNNDGTSKQTKMSHITTRRFKSAEASLGLKIQILFQNSPMDQPPSRLSTKGSGRRHCAAPLRLRWVYGFYGYGERTVITVITVTAGVARRSTTRWTTLDASKAVTRARHLTCLLNCGDGEQGVDRGAVEGALGELCGCARGL